MAYHDLLLHSDAESGAIETYPSIDTVIRPGLRRAFPLPAKGQAADERFGVLLGALAQRTVGTWPAAISLAVLTC